VRERVQGEQGGGDEQDEGGSAADGADCEKREPPEADEGEGDDARVEAWMVQFAPL
jgi:hypothetical protein